ncbi:MAG: hypothetical protein K8S13_09125 [Desulfobacula sp.]|uniref:hypothetical protein n=1 Tax=Desulfobacula sp. TaxID=2593537 RepID=UPI0025B8965B|nr:hypothetical protein [Desulfobacula sp.]MCD4720006.1 hypothetical protein [Desulfobacula sp.]
MIFKIKKSSRIILVLIFLIIFLMVLGGGIFLYFLNKKKSVQDNLPPIIKQMIVLNEDIEKTTSDIYNASGKLDSISMVQSRITDIESAIKLIGDLRQLVEENQIAIDRLTEFIEDHTSFVHRKNLLWVFAIKEFYTNHHVVQHHKSRVNYLAAFETLLKYTHTNFQNIMELQSRQHMRSYDVYYMRYRRAADSHNRFNKKRISFQTAFVEDHPEVTPFLPGAHHTGPFKFWDKFSF